MANQQQVAAGIDLGSNTFRLLIADCSARTPVMLKKKLVTVGLGRGLKEKGLLQQEALQQGYKVLQDFKDMMAEYQPQFIRICGTEALRRARNSRTFLLRAEEILQQPVHLITGEEEACLSLTGALAGHQNFFPLPLLLVDVGGGSTELIFAETSREDIKTVSLPLGVVWLTETYITGTRPDPDSLDRLLKETLGPSLNKLKLLQGRKQFAIIGSGGTATSMAALQLGLSSYNESLVHGSVLLHNDIAKLWASLMALSAEKRNELPCLEDGRGEILPAGIRIYHTLLELLGRDRMRVSDQGLLEGILLSSLPRTPIIS